MLMITKFTFHGNDQFHQTPMHLKTWLRGFHNIYPRWLHYAKNDRHGVTALIYDWFFSSINPAMIISVIIGTGLQIPVLVKCWTPWLRAPGAPHNIFSAWPMSMMGWASRHGLLWMFVLCCSFLSSRDVLSCASLFRMLRQQLISKILAILHMHTLLLKCQSINVEFMNSIKLTVSL